jgi:hypothetical protein
MLQSLACLLISSKIFELDYNIPSSHKFLRWLPKKNNNQQMNNYLDEQQDDLNQNKDSNYRSPFPKNNLLKAET